MHAYGVMTYNIEGEHGWQQKELPMPYIEVKGKFLPPLTGVGGAWW